MIKNLFGLSLICCLAACTGKNNANLDVSLVADKPSENTIAFYEGHDKGKGNTSVAFDDANIYKWSGESPYEHESWGYFDSTGNEISYIKRDRDLGQTFAYNGTSPVKLEAIVVRTGFGTNVVRPNTYGKNISVQLFEVTGAKVLHNNGSDENTEAFHGFPHNRPGDSISTIRDDYFTGEEYKTIAVFTGGKFPGKKVFGFESDDMAIAPGDSLLKGKYLRFSLPQSANVMLQPGKTYAFLVMIDQMDADVGFTLANNYYGSYEGGHGIRRDGNGVFPPEPADPSKDFTDPANRKALEAAHFPENFQERIKIAPGTNGYPDVCTWRDLEFYIIAK
jgi:hypothetical protein